MKNNVKHKTSIGGQALIEGIMMRGPKGNGMAVRMPDGSIDVELDEYHPWSEKYKVLKLPIIRGVTAFIESMTFGYKYLMKSADKALTEEEKEEDLSKFDKWLNDHFGDKIMNIVGVISAVLGVLLAVFIFMYLPTLLVDSIDKYLFVSMSFEKLHPLLEGIMRIGIFVLYMYLVSRTSMIKRVFMYHGAEHKTIFCYEYGLELTVDNVKKMSRFHPRCGTSFMFVMIILSVFVSSILILIFPSLSYVNRFLWIAVKLAILPLIMGLGYEFIKYAGKHDNLFVRILSFPGIMMQHITTVEPTDDIIEVGIEAIKSVLTDNPEDDAL